MPRIALVGVGVCLLAGCGSTEPPDDTGVGDPVGVWDATLESDELSPIVSTAKFCTVHWVMAISPARPGVFITYIPSTATITCDDRDPTQWQPAHHTLEIQGRGDSLFFQEIQGQTLIPAKFVSGSRLSGRALDLAKLYPGGTFTAVRRKDNTDPNLAPYRLNTFGDAFQMFLGDSAPLSVQVEDAYGGALPGDGLRFTSTAPDVASVTDGGVVTALSLGTTNIEVTLDQLSATVEIEVVGK